jgi:DNA helicase-2/ATP-dependent DNA helicase PcrA
VAYLRILVNENDNEALMRIINYPARSIGETTQNKLIVFADSQNVRVVDVLNNLGQYAPQLGLNNGVIAKLADFWSMIKAFQVMLKTENAYTVAMEVAQRSGLIKFLKDDQTPEGISRVENVQELMNSMQGFIDEQKQLEDGDPSLSSFLENIALSTDQDKKSENEDQVSLMTIHLSKGLEFPVVHLVGLEENLFPSFMSSYTRRIRRRAKIILRSINQSRKTSVFSYAISRFQWGKITDAEPSRFLSEIDAEYLEFVNPVVEKKYLTGLA